MKINAKYFLCRKFHIEWLLVKGTVLVGADTCFSTSDLKGWIVSKIGPYHLWLNEKSIWTNEWDSQNPREQFYKMGIIYNCNCNVKCKFLSWDIFQKQKCYEHISMFMTIFSKPLCLCKICLDIYILWLFDLAILMFKNSQPFI